MSERANEQDERDRQDESKDGGDARAAEAALSASPTVSSSSTVSSSPAVPASLVQLVADHHASVYRYAFRLTGVVADAEDLAQQTFLIAQQKGDQVRDAERVRSWLLAVVRNAFLKTRRQRIPMPASGLEIDVSSVPQAAAEELVIDSDALRGAIDELPDEFRVPLLMFYFEENSYREIAEQLDLPAGTVMSRLSRAKSFLRRRLFVEQTGCEATQGEQAASNVTDSTPRDSVSRGDLKRSKV